ncbi:MAG: hypothetical protein ACE5EN_10410 [Nitrospinota bacterium]
MYLLEIFLIGVVLFGIGYPLFMRPKEETTVNEGDEYHNLLYAKDAALLALKELDFDYDTGKVGEEDYRRIKKQFEGEAVAILKQIDKAQKLVKNQAGSKA